MTLAALPNLAIIAVLASQEDTQQPGSMDTTALAIISRLVAHNYLTIFSDPTTVRKATLCNQFYVPDCRPTLVGM